MNPAVAALLRRCLENTMSDLVCADDEYYRKRCEETLEIVLNFLDWMVLDEQHNRRS